MNAILHFTCGAIRYLLFLILPVLSFAQNDENILYLENETVIHGMNQKHSEKIIVKNTHKEPLYVLNETPFYADSSLVATIAFLEKKEEYSKKSFFKTIPTDKRATTKAIVQQQSQFKFQKSSLPFTADRMFKNGITLVVSASNTPIVLKNKNCVLPLQTRINSIDLALTVEVKKTTYTSLFQNRNTLKEGIVTYNRPPPYLLI